MIAETLSEKNKKVLGEGAIQFYKLT